MKEQLLNHFLNYEFIYIFLLCSLIFLLLSIFIKKNIIKKISILLFSIFFILFCFEWILSFSMDIFQPVPINDIYSNGDTTSTKEYREILFIDKNNKFHRCCDLDSDIETKCKDYEKYKNNDYNILYNSTCTLYSNKLRYTKSNIDGNNTYVFLGGSFTFGSNLNDDETLPYYFSELLNFKDNIINLGQGAKGSNSTINILKTNILKENKTISLFIYSLIEDHIYRNFRLGQTDNGGKDPWIKENNEWIITKHPLKNIKLFFKRSFIFRKIFLQIIDEYNKSYYKNYLIKSLQEINKIVEEKYNSKLIIIVWSQTYGNDFIEKLKSINIDLIFLPEYFNSEDDGYRLKDHHPTKKANKEIAEILYNHINNLDNKNKEN